MNAKLKKSGCRISPVKNSGNVYTYTVECSLKMPSGSTFNSRSSSVMTVVSESSYKIEIDVVTDRQSSKELLVARRIGDCKE
jgi:hypothetical protein